MNIKSFCNRNRLKNTNKIIFEKYLSKFEIKIKDLNKNKIESFFKNKNKISIEIGFGNGLFLIKNAKFKSNINFIGIEVYKNGISSCLNLILNNKINNIKIINFDAFYVIKNINKLSVYEINILFPDPWNKKKHNKRRLINKNFLLYSNNILIKNGTIKIVTDSESYKDFIIKEINYFKKIYMYYIYFYNKNKYNTKYENKSLKLNKKIWILYIIKL